MMTMILSKMIKVVISKTVLSATLYADFVVVNAITCIANLL